MERPGRSWKSRIYVILIGIALGLLALAIKGMVTSLAEKPATSTSQLQC